MPKQHFLAADHLLEMSAWAAAEAIERNKRKGQLESLSMTFHLILANSGNKDCQIKNMDSAERPA